MYCYFQFFCVKYQLKKNPKGDKNMRKLPNGMSNYEAIVKDNRIYVDKTMYIEKM